MRAMLMLMASISLVGCSSAHKEIPESDQTMRSIYDEKMYGGDKVINSHERQVSHVRDDDLSHYTRTAVNEIEQLFPRLPNPDLIMYVKPHLAGDLPVPGYTTTFKMYSVDHIAMPGEVVP